MMNSTELQKQFWAKFYESLVQNSRINQNAILLNPYTSYNVESSELAQGTLQGFYNSQDQQILMNDQPSQPSNPERFLNSEFNQVDDKDSLKVETTNYFEDLTTEVLDLTVKRSDENPQSPHKHHHCHCACDQPSNGHQSSFFDTTGDSAFSESSLSHNISGSLESSKNNDIIYFADYPKYELQITPMALDLSLPKSTAFTSRSTGTQFEIIAENVIYSQDGDQLPEDLPDLRFSEFIRNIPSTRQNKFRRWIYSVRRRVLKISTLKQMFGLHENDPTEIRLLFGGKGVKNPLESNLKRPITRNVYKNKFTCRYCERDFKNSQILSRHYIQHTSYRRFFCTVCWRGFYDSYDLKRHSLRHPELRVFYCELCEAIYSQNTTKPQHFIKVHPNVVITGGHDDGEEDRDNGNA